MTASRVVQIGALGIAAGMLLGLTCTTARAEADPAAILAVAVPWQIDTDLRLRGDYFPERAQQGGGLAQASLRAAGGDSTTRAALNAQWRQSRIDAQQDEDLLLREAYVAHRQESWRAVLGKQLLLWGRADGFRVLDVLVPTDVPDIFYEEPEQARRGLWAARLEWQAPDLGDGARNSELQLWFTPDRSLQRNAPAAADLPAQRERADRCGGRCGSGALRWSSQLGRVDWSVHALQGLWRETATPELPDGARVAPTVTAAGASLDVPIDHVVLRGEFLQITRTRSPVPHAVPTQRALIGLDINVRGVLVSPQLFQERGRIDSRYASLLVDARLQQDRLRLRLFAAQSLQQSGQRWVSGRLRWIASDAWELGLSVDEFSGAPDSSLGALNLRSRVSLDLIWHGRWRNASAK